MKVKHTTIIVDDESHARFRLRQLLEQTGRFEIIAEARDGNEGKNLINSLRPEVTFLDIRMPEMDGFEMLEYLDYDPYVVFCTAFNQFAIKAFETCSVDYLLKPVEMSRLLTTVEKLYRLSEQTALINQYKVELQKKDSNQKSNIIPIKIGDRIILLNLDNVVWFEANSKSVHLYDSNGKKYLVDFSLNNLETKLPDNFIRVSRFAIVNKDYIAECRKYLKGNSFSC